MKTCSRCNEKKDDSAFGQRRGKLQAYCKDCQNAYSQQHYRSNKKVYSARNDKKAKEWQNAIRQLKDVPCADCGNRFHFSAMDFDHVKGKKRASVGNVRSFSSLEVLMKEVAKCEVICSNCHRLRTWKRNNRGVVQRQDNGL